jgi:predicted DNA-binding protein
MRLPEEDYEALQAMSLLTGKKMAELVRDAIVDKVTEFARSGDMQDRLEAEAQLRQAAAAKLEERAAAVR